MSTVPAIVFCSSTSISMSYDLLVLYLVCSEDHSVMRLLFSVKSITVRCIHPSICSLFEYLAPSTDTALKCSTIDLTGEAPAPSCGLASSCVDLNLYRPAGDMYSYTLRMHSSRLR